MVSLHKITLKMLNPRSRQWTLDNEQIQSIHNRFDHQKTKSTMIVLLLNYLYYENNSL
jgi:hypothetical protein